VSTLFFPSFVFVGLLNSSCTPWVRPAAAQVDNTAGDSFDLYYASMHNTNATEEVLYNTVFVLCTDSFLPSCAAQTVTRCIMLYCATLY